MAQAASTAELVASLRGESVHLAGKSFPPLVDVRITTEWGPQQEESVAKAGLDGAFEHDLAIPSGFVGLATFTARAKFILKNVEATATSPATPAAPTATPTASASVTGETIDPGPKLFVAPTGDDANPGTEDKPFQTIAKARDVLRTQRGGATGEKTTIYLRNGVYSMPQSFELGAADANTSYRSYPGEQATLMGGVSLTATNFTPVSDAQVLGRIQPAERNAVREVDLGKLGITDIPSPPRLGQGIGNESVQHELFVDGQPMTLARFPNEGFLKTANATGSDGQAISFTSQEAVGKSWTPSPDNMIQGYPKYEWADASLHIASFDPGTGRVTTSDESPYGAADGKPFYFFNILEELDASGEYYVNRTAKKLYVLPPAGWEQKSLQLSALDKPIVAISDTRDVEIHNVTVTAARGDGIAVNGSTNVSLSNVTIHNIGRVGIAIDGGQNVQVKSSAISQVGQGGVDVVGGDRETLASAGHFVEDTVIRQYSRIRHTYSPAISLSGVGNRSSHNEISESPHLGIVLHGNEHVVEYNNIHHIETESGDVGAIYLGRDWSEAGNIIRYNYLHDLGSDEYNNQNGIYLDDFASGTLVEGNIIARTDNGMLLGGGRNNTFRNNVTIATTHPLVFDARGAGWASAACTTPGGIMHRNLANVPYTSSVWATKYPWLAGIPQKEPCLPRDNVIESNVFWGGDENTDDEAKTGNTFTGNWYTANDPGFVDAGASNYRFASTANVTAQSPNFQPPPFEQMGVRK